MRDTDYLNVAIKEARFALDTEDVPVGAIIVKDGEVIATACNEKEKTGDLTAHAEVLAIRRAAAALGDWRLNDCTLYCTLEPCAMCAGTIVQARIPRIVYAAKDIKTGACGSFLSVLNAEVLEKRVELSYIPMDESVRLLQDFFKARR